MQPTISVIIPVYNAEKYLRKCLDSIKNQTYPHLQIICVDDCSTDCSFAILQEYASADERFCIHKKENEGVSIARNYGLLHADGAYILFVDSDDWIEPDTCAIALEAAQENAADVVMWSYVRELGSDSRRKIIFNEDYLFGEEEVHTKLYRRMAGVCAEELSKPENADALCTVWGKLYRRSLIEENGIRFYDIRKIGTYEDGLFNLEAFSCASKAVFLNRYLYHYRKNNSASLTTAFNPKLREQREHMIDLINSHIQSRPLDPTFSEAVKNRIVLGLIPLGINEIARPGGVREQVSTIRSILKENRYREAIADFQFRFLPLHWKLFFACARMRWALPVYLMLLAIQKIRGGA